MIVMYRFYLRQGGTIFFTRYYLNIRKRYAHTLLTV
jgi:hypothetical protein